MYMKPGEVRTAVGVVGHDVAVEHCGFRWQLVQQLCDGRKPFGELVPIGL